MPLSLLLTVDTEEEFDWNAPVSSRNRSVRHVVELPRFQDLFESLGVRPTYVVDHPIATTDESIRVLKEFQDRGAVEIGAHVHPWVNPPLSEEICPRNTFLCNLPRDLQIEKTTVLSDAIETAFGQRPTTFKAGRYGVDFAFADDLAALGYTVDTSVIAHMDFSGEAGPNFTDFGNDPFVIKSQSVGGGPISGAAEPLLEIPCTVGFTRRPQRRWARIHRRLAAPPLSRLRAVGVLWHTRLLRKIVLSPEGYSAADMIRLARTLARDSRNTVLNVTLHSPSVQPGNTPYVRTTAERDAFLATLRQVLEFCIRRLGARCFTMREFRDHFLQSTRNDHTRSLSAR